MKVNLLLLSYSSPVCFLHNQTFTEHNLPETAHSPYVLFAGTGFGATLLRELKEGKSDKSSVGWSTAQGNKSNVLHSKAT